MVGLRHLCIWKVSCPLLFSFQSQSVYSTFLYFLWTSSSVECCDYTISLLHGQHSIAGPWTITHQAPLSMGFPRQAYWSGLPFPSPGNLPDPGIEPRTPALQADSLPSEGSANISLLHGHNSIAGPLAWSSLVPEDSLGARQVPFLFAERGRSRSPDRCY